MTTAPAVNHLLERAVVKVLINDTFKGTCFFISPDYVLTAYHCLNTLVDGQNIYVENQTYGRMRVLLEREKSLPDPKQDIAVLQLVDKEVADFLPLGVVNETQRGDEILAVGYPAGILSFISGEIHGFPEEFPQQFFNNAMKAKGQSGGVVYHPTLRRVVGIALELYHQQVVANGGLAGRFDVLLRQWQALETLNQQAIARWDNLLQPKPLLSKPIVMTWGSVISAVLLIMWLLLGRIDNTVVNNNAYYGISPETFAKYTSDLGVTDAALTNFFKILEQNKVDRLDLDKRLSEIAQHYKELLAKAQMLTSTDSEVQKLRQEAVKAIEKFDFENADKWLKEAQEKDDSAIQVLETEDKRIQEAINERKLSRVDSLVTLANSKATQLKYVEAADYYQQVAKLLPVGHEKDKGDYLNNAGLALHRVGKYQQALPLYQEALRIREQVLSKQHKDYAESLNNLAELHREQGQYERALPLYQEALITYEQVLGKQNPYYAETLNNLALLYQSQRQYEQALPLLKDALEIREHLGTQSKDYAESLNNLALFYYIQKKYEQALPLYQKSLKIREQVLGKEHPDYAQSLNNLALLYNSQGKYEEALPLYQEALKIREQVLGKEHPYYALSLNNLAELYRTQGKYEEALPWYQQAYHIFKNALGEKHPNTQVVAKNLRRAQDYLDGKKYQVIVEQVLPDSRAVQLGIQAGDIFTHYDQQPILDSAQFIQGRAKEPADGAAKELTVLRDDKSLTFQLKSSKIGVELEEKLKSEP